MRRVHYSPTKKSYMSINFYVSLHRKAHVGLSPSFPRINAQDKEFGSPQSLIINHPVSCLGIQCLRQRLHVLSLCSAIIKTHLFTPSFFDQQEEHHSSHKPEFMPRFLLNNQASPSCTGATSVSTEEWTCIYVHIHGPCSSRFVGITEALTENPWSWITNLTESLLLNPAGSLCLGS